MDYGSPWLCVISNAGGMEDRLALEGGTGAVSDVSGSVPSAYVCEVEVTCPPGHTCAGVSMVRDWMGVGLHACVV
jgi:hypothetical protein